MSAMLMRALVCMVLVAAGAAPAQNALTSIGAARLLSPARAAEEFPVEIDAMVTYVDLPNGGVFIHDRTEGIYLNIPPMLRSNLVIQTGARVRIKAVTDPGNYLPALVCKSLTIDGLMTPPGATLVTPKNLFSPGLDCQWVQVTGVIVSVERDDVGQVVFTLELYGWTLKVVTRLSDEEIRDAPGLMQQRVTFEGVAATIFNQQRQMTGRYFLVPSLKSIRPIGDDAVANAPANLSVAGLLNSETTSDNAVRVRGIVTAATRSELYLRGEGGSLRVLVPGSRSYDRGDEVEVLGFATLAPFRPVLRAREVNKLRSGNPLKPVDMAQAIGNLPSLQAELVSVANVLYLGAQDNPDGTVLHCRVQDHFFEAILPRPFSPPSELAPGSMINIVGICELTTTHPLPRSEWVDGFRLHLAKLDDLMIVRRPSWWTTQRLLAALAVAAGLGIMAVSLIWVLRRQVVAQTKIIGAQIEREATLQERQRIARELHDSIEQEMTGVAIQVGHARRQLGNNPQNAGAALILAEEMIRHCREEARSSIRDLRSVALEQGGLERAIQDLLSPSAIEAGIKFKLNTRGAVGRLDARLENDLLRVAQEAAANAIHHASPSQIGITLDYAPDAVMLVIQDDGCGFDASATPQRGHFGLLGMQERANQQHGLLTIESRPGKGTKVSLRIPLSPGNGIVPTPS